MTTELGKQRMIAQGIQVSACEHMEMFVRGREVPAHVRWAETEALILAGEWD